MYMRRDSSFIMALQNNLQSQNSMTLQNNLQSQNSMALQDNLQSQNSIMVLQNNLQSQNSIMALICQVNRNSFFFENAYFFDGNGSLKTSVFSQWPDIKTETICWCKQQKMLNSLISTKLARTAGEYFTIILEVEFL